MIEEARIPKYGELEYAREAIGGLSVNAGSLTEEDIELLSAALLDLRATVVQERVPVLAEELLEQVNGGDIELARTEYLRHLAFEHLLTLGQVLFGGVQETEDAIVYKSVHLSQKGVDEKAREFHEFIKTVERARRRREEE